MINSDPSIDTPSNSGRPDPSSQGKVDLVVFMADGAKPSGFWSTQEALEWAVHPVGVPPSLKGAFPIEDMTNDEARLCLVSFRKSFEKESQPHPSSLPGGAVAWFQSTPTGIVVGLGVRRYTFVLNPPPGVLPYIKTEAYRGGTLGWQPRLGANNVLWEVLLWNDWSTSEVPGSSLGQHLLATHGLRGLKSKRADHVLFCLAHLDSSELTSEHLYVSGNAVEYQSVKRDFRKWLSRKWLQASRQHPGMKGVRAWYSIHGNVRTNPSTDGYVEDGLIKDISVYGRAHLCDPRQLTGRASALSNTETRDPGRLLGDWFDAGLWRGVDIFMPNLSASRWWLALDAKSAVNLCEATFPRVPWAGLVLTTTCDIASKQGDVRVTRKAAHLLASIPALFWLAYWIECKSDQWEAMKAAAYGIQGQSEDKDNNGFFVEIKNAQSFAQKYPQALQSFAWLVRQVLWNAPMADLMEKDELNGRSRAQIVWDWLWDCNDDYKNARKILSLTKKTWRWNTLVKHHDEWLKRQEFELSMEMEVELEDSNSEDERPWVSALGQVVWSDCEIYPIRTKAALGKAGARYLNCMRNSDALADRVRCAREHTHRWFLLKSPRASGLLEIRKKLEGEWEVGEFLCQANRQPPDDLKQVASRVAQVYTMLTNIDVSGPAPEVLAKSAEDPVCPVAKDVGVALACWLEAKAGPKPFVWADGSMIQFTWAELCAPDGILPTWLGRISSQVPKSVVLKFHRNSSALVCFTPSITATPSEVSIIVEAMKNHWIKTATLNTTEDGVDITEWFPGPTRTQPA